MYFIHEPLVRILRATWISCYKLIDLFFNTLIDWFLMPQVCFKPIKWYMYIDMHHARTFFSVWGHDFFILPDIHSKQVYLQEEKLTVLFVCHRTVSMAAVYQLKTKCDQDNNFPKIIHLLRQTKVWCTCKTAESTSHKVLDTTIFVCWILRSYLLLLVFDLLGGCVVLLLSFLCSSSQSKHKMKGGLFLDVVIAKSTSIFKLFTSENQSLLVRWNS